MLIQTSGIKAAALENQRNKSQFDSIDTFFRRLEKITGMVVQMETKM